MNGFMFASAIPMPHMRNTLIWQIASYFCDMIPVLASNLGGTLWIPSKKAFTTIVTQDTILGELDTTVGAAIVAMTIIGSIIIFYILDDRLVTLRKKRRLKRKGDDGLPSISSDTTESSRLAKDIMLF